MQIIPAIDIRGGKCVRLRQGDYNQETVFADDPVDMAKRWADDGAQRLHLVDLDGAKDGRPTNADVVRRITAAVSIPCQFGGGIRNDDAVRLMLDDVGVDRVIIGTQALKQPGWFRDLAEAHPGKIALGIDARDNMVSTEGWLEDSKTTVVELAKRDANLPLAAVIYTNIANDGMMQGIDSGTLDTMRQLCELGLPVIASGGVTTLDDVRNLAELHREQPNLIGAIIGRALYEGTIPIAEANSIAANP